jgi:hypothetical protein
LNHLGPEVGGTVQLLNRGLFEGRYCYDGRGLDVGLLLLGFVRAATQELGLSIIVLSLLIHLEI